MNVLGLLLLGLFVSVVAIAFFMYFRLKQEQHEQVGFEVKLITGIPPVEQRKDNDHG